MQKLRIVNKVLIYDLASTGLPMVSFLCVEMALNPYMHLKWHR